MIPTLRGGVEREGEGSCDTSNYCNVYRQGPWQWGRPGASAKRTERARVLPWAMSIYQPTYLHSPRLGRAVGISDT